ncbi:putative phage abortive infection protein [Pseudomonas psychrophila]|uniref:putative phage abortive infection protein n=1 Tax=Pseudomonas psychrophila TaxID=122355 RepID=UPI0002F9DE47|nr:putative phage abortive infection protein [Pseudomonas psychrophila]
MLDRLINFFHEKPAPNGDGRTPTLNVKKVIAAGTLLVVLTVGAFAVSLIWLTWPVSELSIDKSGTFGDSFGALNALFTGLGFMGLLVTIFLQREDLKLTREELSETRQEIKTQSKTFQQQQFEESFYRLLTLYKENLSTLSANNILSSHEKSYGIDALSVFLTRFDNAWRKHKSYKFPDHIEDKEEYVYLLFQTSHSVFIRQGRYIATFIALLNMIEKDSHAAERKESYLAILSSQLTIYELKYLFYQSFIMTDAAPIRALWRLSPSFGQRLGTAGIPDSHRKSFEFYWECLLPIGSSRCNPMDQGKWKAVRKRTQKHKRSLSKTHLGDSPQVDEKKSGQIRSMRQSYP